MGVNRIFFLGLVAVIILTSQGVHAENPKLIFTKESNCGISGISLNKNGKLIGYSCGSASIITLNITGTVKQTDIIGFDYHGFTWDNDLIVATNSTNSSTRGVYFFSSNGTIIKDFKVEARLSITNMVFSPNGKFIVLVSGNKYQQYLEIYDEEGNLIGNSTNNLLPGLIYSVSVSNNGDVAVLVNYKVSEGFRTIQKSYVIRYRKNGELAFQKEIDYSEGFVRISPDGQRIAVAVESIIKLFRGIIFLDNLGNELWRYNKWDSRDIEGKVNDLEIRYSGEYSVILAYKNIIEIIDEQGRQIGNHTANKSVDLVSVSEKGDHVLISSNNNGYLYYLDNTVNVKPSIAVLANSIDYELNPEFLNFLKNKGLRVTRVTTDVFDQYKNENFVVILGGPDAPAEVGDVVREVLTNYEQNAIREKGAKKMFVKTNVWTLGQKVMVIAGSGRDQTKASHQENKDKLYEEIKSSNQLTPTQEAHPKSLSPILVWNFTSSTNWKKSNVSDLLITSDERYVAINYDDNKAFVLDSEGTEMWGGINRGDARNTIFTYSGKLAQLEEAARETISNALYDGYLVKISEEGRFVVIEHAYIKPFTKKGTIVKWDSYNPRTIIWAIESYKYPPNNIKKSAAITRDGNYLVWAPGNGDLILFNITRDVNVLWSNNATISGNIFRVGHYYPKMTDEPKYIVTIDLNRQVILFDITGKVLWNHEIDALLTGVGISSDGSCIGVTTNKQIFYLFDSSGNLISSQVQKGNLSSISVSNGCKYIAIGADDVAYYYTT